MRTPRILFIMLEYPQWQDASHWGYTANMGMEPGFIAHSIEYFILPATHRYGGKKAFWIDHTRQLLQGKTFDQVWIEVVHSNIEDDILDFITTLAPIRLGFTFESLELLPVEWENNPNACRIREEIIKKRLSALTHVVTTDELDAPRLNELGHIAARPLPPGFIIPREFIAEAPQAPVVDKGIFFGALYGERRSWLEDPKLAEVLCYAPQSPELHTPFPAAFDRLHLEIEPVLNSQLVDPGLLASYLSATRTIRKECFKLWLDGLRLGSAVVNLPQWGRAYASRVVEGMAAGRPVIAQEMPNRPLARAAFEDGKEILLYRTRDELAAHLERVIKDPHFARTLASNAQRRLIAEHTTEGYVDEILRWVS